MHRRITALLAIALLLCAALVAPQAAFAADEGTLDTVYLGSTADVEASDDNDGATAQTPVATFDRARDLLASDGTIVLLSPLRPQGEVTYSLEGKGDAKVVPYRHEGGFAGSLLFISGDAEVTLEHIIVDGGGESDTMDSTVNMEGGSLTLGDGAVLQNRSCNKGAFGIAIEAMNGSHITMLDGSTIRDNHGEDHKVAYGTVFIANGCVFDMQDGVIEDNSASRGGAVAVVSSTMNMSGGTIQDNAVHRESSQGAAYGGAIYVSNYEEYTIAVGSQQPIKDGDSKFTMTGGTIQGNTAEVYGGAICTLTNGNDGSTGTCYVDIQQGTITGNSAGTGGGAISVWDLGGLPTSNLSISGGEITSNSTDGNGGAILVYGLDGEDQAVMTSGAISGNSADVAGGGIMLYTGTGARMAVTGGSITDNVSTAGAGAFVGRDCTLTMTGGSIEGNNGDEDQSATLGDGVYVGGAFEVADGENGGPVVDQNNDVYLPSGHVIDVVDAFTGATAANPINITSADLAVEPKDASTPGTKLVRYHDAAGGVDAAEQVDADGIYVPSAKMYERDATLVIGKSMHDDQLDYMTYVTEDPTLTLEVLDMTAYTGGDSYDNDPFPAPRYRVRMNAPLSSALGADGLDGLALTDAAGDEVELVEVADGVVMIPGVEEAYAFQGTAAQGRSARSGAADDAQAGLYEVALAAGESLEAKTDAGSDVAVEVDPGTLTVRYVNDADEVASGATELTTAVLAEGDLASSDNSTFRAVVDGSAAFTTNNRAELGLAGTDGTAGTAEPALLADELLLADDGSGREPAMQARAESYLEGQGVSTADRCWDFQYLDLVNAHDGNAWIASSTGADVYWPYPAGTDQNTEFTLVRYSDLYREYGINGVEAIDEALATTELSTVAVENTPYGIRFHVDTDGYGPFALSWVGDGGQSPAPDQTPAGPQAPSATVPGKETMPGTGDATLTVVGAVLALGVAAIAGGSLIALRRRE